MKVRELNAAFRLLKQVLRAEGLESVYRQRIRTIAREMGALRKGGKLPNRRLVRIVSLLSEIIVDGLLKRPDEWK